MTEDDQQYIYAIAHPHNYVKLGHSKDPSQRLRDHQISSPYELWILVQIPVKDPKEAEAALHDHLSEKNVSGEWFELDYDDYDMLADLVKMAASGYDFETVGDFRAWQDRKREAMI